VRFVLFAIAPLMLAQSGADVFAKTCGSGYCHGANGQGGGAPKLAARGFDEAYITSVTRAGVPGTAMQGYGTTLTRPEFAAVVAYVAGLNGIAPRTDQPATKTVTGEAAKGRDLFSDPVRGFARCSTCHQVNGVGIAVAAIGRIPLDLRNITSSHVRFVQAGEEKFPALIVSQGGRRVSVYDLSVAPPVLRSFDSGEVKIGDPAALKHPDLPYSEAELKSIGAFLRAR